MTSADSEDNRLADLRRRWEEEPGSRLFLQLAEEYRRDGRREEALEVLQRGLEAHPLQVSGLVSLGRLHLEMGQAAQAAAALEKAVSIDPTNLAAMKLAVEAYLAQGDRDNARQRLELYKLLNAGDPEVGDLEARVEGRAPAPPPQDGTPDAAATPADDGGAAEAVAAPTWSPTAAWPGLPADAESVTGEEADDEPPPPPADAPAADVAATATATTDGSSAPTATASTSSTAVAAMADGGEEPFGDLAGAANRRRYLDALGAEGIFPLEAEPEPPFDAEPSIEAEPPFEAWPTGDAESEVAAEGEAAAAPAEGGWQLDDEEDLPLPDDEQPGEGSSDGRWSDAAGASAAITAGDRPTSTLGQLYLDQGHPGEALRIFEAVLARDADNETARTGLLRARAALDRATAEAPRAVARGNGAPPSASPLTAGQLLRGADPSQPRRQAMLHAYLNRLRGRSV